MCSEDIYTHLIGATIEVHTYAFAGCPNYLGLWVDVSDNWPSAEYAILANSVFGCLFIIRR